MVSERVPTSSTLAPADLVGRPAESVLDVVTGAPVARVARYGYGKAALRDGLAAQGYEPGASVLLPALVPDGVVEPIEEVGLEPRFYGVGDDLAPAVAEVEAALDAAEADDGPGAAAIVAVHYFGFPQPGFDALADLAGARGVDLVSDNAHGALSRSGGRLLGTRGAFGITSLRKLLPVPDGAALYLNRGADAYDRVRSSYAGVAGGYRPGEAAFLARSLALGVRDRHPTATGALKRVGSGGVHGVRVGDRLPTPPEANGTNGTDEGSGTCATNGNGETCGSRNRDPGAVYREAKRPMSRLSARVCARTDAGAVVADRRETYRTWIDHLEDVPGVQPVYDGLPTGACPQSCPVLTASADRAESITRIVPGTHTWPPLPRQVAESEAFSGVADVASRLVPLPCQRTVDRAAVRRATARLR